MPDSITQAPSHAAIADVLVNATTSLSFHQTSRSNGVGANPESVLGPQYHSHVRITVILIMIAFSVSGNSVVCWRLLRNHRRRRYQKAHVLFLNLAVADLLVTTVTMTSQTVWEVMGRVWIAGDAFCRVFKVLQTFALASSTYMIVSIALDRHFAIVYPLARCPAPWRLAAAAWIAALVPSLPNLYVFQVVEADTGVRYCASLFYARKTASTLPRQLYMTFVFLAVFVLPLVLLVGLYGRILLEIWSQSLAFRNRHQTASSLPKAKVKTVRLTAAVFAAFLVTNVPYMVQEMVLAFGGANVSLDRNLVALFGVISASNSAINPYIFLCFQKTNAKRKRFVMAFRRDVVAESELVNGRSSFGGTKHYPTSVRNHSTVFTLSTKETNGKISPELRTDLSAL
ncbi:oxytocin receptor-like [Rhipicephalus microplus]|uniref:oxytocin receptor-like n=1 Tax=Rhipicephalus microplus TaxID=6941 RepID=UPI003F6BD1BC